LKHFEAEIRFIAGQSQHGVDLDDELGANAAGRPRRSAAAAAATAILQQSTGTSLFYFYIVRITEYPTYLMQLLNKYFYTGLGVSDALLAATDAANALLAERGASGGYESDDVDSRPGRLELAIDPSEPVYCSCRQVAFGDMVACDNQGECEEILPFFSRTLYD
jgi:hypothetical protein